MKETIDLTEYQLFSSSNHLEDFEIDHMFDLSKYIHKKTPWERTEEGEPAKRVPLLLLENYLSRQKIRMDFITSNIDMFTLDVTPIESDEDLYLNSIDARMRINSDDDVWIIDDEIEDSPRNRVYNTSTLTINEVSSREIDRYNRTTLLSWYSNTNTSHTSYVDLYNTTDLYSKKIRGYIDKKTKESVEEEWLSLIPKNKAIFPTGKRDEIKAMRKPYIPYDTERDTRSLLRTTLSSHICKRCGKNLMRKSYGIDYILVDLCQSCIDEKRISPTKHHSRVCYEFIENRLYIDLEDEERSKKIEEKFFHLESSHYHPLNVNPKNIPYLFMERFCEESEVSSYQEVKYNDFFFTNSFYEEYFRNHSHYVKSAVYFSHRELRRREEAWMPRGRVPQWYDKLFEEMDWKKLFKKETESLSLT